MRILELAFGDGIKLLLKAIYRLRYLTYIYI